MSKRRMSVDEVLRKYGGKIESQLTGEMRGRAQSYSSDYVEFKSEMAPELNRYERWCNSLGNFIKVKVSAKDRRRVARQLEVAHLDVSAEQAITLNFMTFFSVFLIGLISSLAIMLLRPVPAESGSLGFVANFPAIYFFLMILLSLFMYFYVSGYPARLANQWRLKASSQMVPAILYVVVYMRHTSNLEKAIAFASEHLEPPLALDFKKVFYDVQVGRFHTIKESLDHYLEGWRDYSTEFIESFHLIESSLYEPDSQRRIRTLEKSLQVVLDGVYDRMLQFTHDVRSPLTNVYMLGVVLPTLMLALLPLASIMLQGILQWYHVFLLFNMIVPFFVFYLTDKVLMQRPGGYGETSLLERNPDYPSFVSKAPYFKAFALCLPLFILGLLPLFFGFTPLPQWLGIPSDFTMGQMGLSVLGEDTYFFDFITLDDGTIRGPYGIGALFLSLLFPLGVGLFYSLSFKWKTQALMEHRRTTSQLEDEFSSSLFQVGNRLGNGVPPELVFGKVAQSSKGLRTQEFFSRVHHNIHQSGMSVERAIFDRRLGALVAFPSSLIATSMRILVESSKKGLAVASVSLMSISEYLKNIRKINDRLRDLLAEIVSDMKSNMTFLAPLLSGIVVGLAAMITGILTYLELPGGEGIGGFIPDGFLGFFSKENMLSPYFLQIAVGLYIIQIIFILTATLVTVDRGQDKLEKMHSTGKFLMRGVLLYLLASFFVILTLSFLVAVVLGGALQ